MKETEVDSKKSTLEVTKALVQGDIARKSLTCYTPDTWSTDDQNDISAFVTTSSGTTAATLPKGSRVVTVRITTLSAVINDGTSTYDIGTHTDSGTTSNNIFDGLLLASINTNENIVWASVAQDVAGIVGLSAAHYVTIKTLDAGPNTAGKLRLDILYEV